MIKADKVHTLQNLHCSGDKKPSNNQSELQEGKCCGDKHNTAMCRRFAPASGEVCYSIRTVTEILRAKFPLEQGSEEMEDLGHELSLARAFLSEGKWWALGFQERHA